MKYSIQFAYRFRRLLGISLAAAGFAVLFLAARTLGFDLKIAGISDEHLRPIGHFCVYGSLAAVMAKVLWNRHLLAWLITVLLATGEEVHQLFVPYRYGDIADWAVNVVGITMFLVVAKFVMPRLVSRLNWQRGVRRRLGLGT